MGSKFGILPSLEKSNMEIDKNNMNNPSVDLLPESSVQLPRRSPRRLSRKSFEVINKSPKLGEMKNLKLSDAVVIKPGDVFNDESTKETPQLKLIVENEDLGNSQLNENEIKLMDFVINKVKNNQDRPIIQKHFGSHKISNVENMIAEGCSNETMYSELRVTAQDILANQADYSKFMKKFNFYSTPTSESGDNQLIEEERIANLMRGDKKISKEKAKNQKTNNSCENSKEKISPVNTPLKKSEKKKINSPVVLITKLQKEDIMHFNNIQFVHNTQNTNEASSPSLSFSSSLDSDAGSTRSLLKAVQQNLDETVQNNELQAFTSEMDIHATLQKNLVNYNDTNSDDSSHEETRNTDVEDSVKSSPQIEENEDKNKDDFDKNYDACNLSDQEYYKKSPMQSMKKADNINYSPNFGSGGELFFGCKRSLMLSKKRLEETCSPIFKRKKLAELDDSFNNDSDQESVTNSEPCRGKLCTPLNDVKKLNKLESNTSKNRIIRKSSIGRNITLVSPMSSDDASEVSPVEKKLERKKKKVPFQRKTVNMKEEETKRFTVSKQLNYATTNFLSQNDQTQVCQFDPNEQKKNEEPQEIAEKLNQENREISSEDSLIKLYGEDNILDEALMDIDPSNQELNNIISNNVNSDEIFQQVTPLLSFVTFPHDFLNIQNTNKIDVSTNTSPVHITPVDLCQNLYKFFDNMVNKNVDKKLKLKRKSLKQKLRKEKLTRRMMYLKNISQQNTSEEKETLDQEGNTPLNKSDFFVSFKPSNLNLPNSINSTKAPHIPSFNDEPINIPDCINSTNVSCFTQSLDFEFIQSYDFSFVISSSDDEINDEKYETVTYFPCQDDYFNDRTEEYLLGEDVLCCRDLGSNILINESDFSNECLGMKSCSVYYTRLISRSFVGDAVEFQAKLKEEINCIKDFVQTIPPDKIVKNFIKKLCPREFFEGNCNNASLCSYIHKLPSNWCYELEYQHTWHIANILLKSCHNPSVDLLMAVLHWSGHKIKDAYKVLLISEYIIKSDSVSNFENVWRGVVNSLMFCGLKEWEAVSWLFIYHCTKNSTENVDKLISGTNILKRSYANFWLSVRPLTQFGIKLPLGVIKKVLEEVCEQTKNKDFMTFPKDSISEINNEVNCLSQKYVSKLDTLIASFRRIYNRYFPVASKGCLKKTNQAPNYKRITSKSFIPDDIPPINKYSSLKNSPIVMERDKIVASIARALNVEDVASIAQTIIKYSQIEEYQEFAIQTLSELIPKCKAYSLTKAIFHQINQDYDSGNGKQVLARLCLTQIMQFAEKQQWKPAYDFLLLIRENHVNPIISKPVGYVCSQVKVAIACSEINFYSKHYNSAIAVLINNCLLTDDISKWKIEGSSADFELILKHVSFLFTNLMDIIDVAIPFFSKILEIQHNLSTPIDLGDYYEPLLCNMLQKLDKYKDRIIPFYTQVNSIDSTLVLTGLTYRALLVLSNQMENHKFSKEMINKAIQRYVYFPLDKEDNTIFISTCMVQEEMEVYLVEWLRWYYSKKNSSSPKCELKIKFQVSKTLDHIENKDLPVFSVILYSDYHLSAAVNRINNILENLADTSMFNKPSVQMEDETLTLSPDLFKILIEAARMAY